MPAQEMMSALAELYIEAQVELMGHGSNFIYEQKYAYKTCHYSLNKKTIEIDFNKICN